MKVDLSSFSNPEYTHGRSIITRVLWMLAGRIFINTGLPWPMAIKIFVLKSFGARLGRGLVLKPRINLKHPWMLVVGHNCWIGENVWIDNLVSVNLDDNVCISQGAMLLTGNHDYTTSSFLLITGPIELQEGSWIGAQAIVCPGVTCKSHSILSVGSVASKDLEPYGIYRGNPAVRVKTREIVTK